MKSSVLVPLALLVLGTRASWAAESAREPVKAGVCPGGLLASCSEMDNTECQNDWMCSGKKRCCDDGCRMKCLKPVKLRYPGKKPGRCPKIVGGCNMQLLKNYCKKDVQCPDNFKCCRGACGKACFAPVYE